MSFNISQGNIISPRLLKSKQMVTSSSFRSLSFIHCTNINGNVHTHGSVSDCAVFAKQLFASSIWYCHNARWKTTWWAKLEPNWSIFSSIKIMFVHMYSTGTCGQVHTHVDTLIWKKKIIDQNMTWIWHDSKFMMRLNLPLKLFSYAVLVFHLF